MVNYTYTAPPNDEVKVLVIYMQGPLRIVLTFMVHTKDIYNVLIQEITLCEWLKKVERNCLDGSAPVCLHIQKLETQFLTHDISFIITLGLINHETKNFNP